MSPVCRAHNVSSVRALGRAATLAAAVMVATAACDRKMTTSLVRVSSIDPSTGPAGAATSFRITGSGFEAGATVMIGVHFANIVVVNETTIQGTTPTNGEGRAAVIVTNPDGGQGTLYSGFTFVK